MPEEEESLPLELPNELNPLKNSQFCFRLSIITIQINIILQRIGPKREYHERGQRLLAPISKYSYRSEAFSPISFVWYN